MDRIKVLPPATTIDEFTPKKPFVTKFRPGDRFSNPVQRVPLMYGFACPSCVAAGRTDYDAIVNVQDGSFVYTATIENITEDDWLEVNVNRPHVCYRGSTR